MPVTRPSDYPDFCTGATPNVDQTGLPVSNGYDDSGAGSIPTAKNWNWLAQCVGLWVRFLEYLTGTIAPVGTVLPYMGVTAPTNYLICDGSSFIGTTYPALASLLSGTTLPDLRGKFLVGYDNAGSPDPDYNSIGKLGGQKNMSTHNHVNGSDEYYDDNASRNIRISSHYSGAQDVPGLRFPSGQMVDGDYGGVRPFAAGSGSIADENRPPFFTINYIIRAL